MSDSKNNSGHSNSGNSNSGHSNSGNSNSGDWNSGHSNSGDWNSGNSNSGHSNSGDWNSGNRNSGHSNSGDWNSGHRNSGHSNSGNSNSGDWNSGHRNSGDWNSGNRNSGFFNTETPSPAFFDRPTDLSWDQAYDLIPWVDLPVGCVWIPESDMSEEEKESNPNHTTIGGYLKVRDMPITEAFPKAWEKLDKETRQRFLDLPNFDADKFKQITGVDVSRHDQSDPCDAEITVNGKKYRLVEEG